jgi:hypothetical protein
MDSGWAGILGAVVGGAASIAATWLSDTLRNRQANRLSTIRKQRLTQLLSGDKFTWRSIEVLSDAIGADEEATAALLLEIGARRSMASGKDSWALISRAPFPPDVA